MLSEAVPSGQPCILRYRSPYEGFGAGVQFCETHKCSAENLPPALIHGNARCLAGRVEDIEARVAVVEQLVRRLTETIKGAPDA